MLADRQTDGHTDVHITVLRSPPLYSSGDTLADRRTRSSLVAMTSLLATRHLLYGVCLFPAIANVGALCAKEIRV